jgi:hypothetical protein
MSTPEPPPGQPEYVPVHPLLPDDPPKIGGFWLDARLTAGPSGVVYTGHGPHPTDATAPAGGVPVMIVLLSEGGGGGGAAPRPGGGGGAPGQPREATAQVTGDPGDQHDPSHGCVVLTCRACDAARASS